MKNLTLNIIYSRRDTYGNCYFAFEAFNPETGKTARGTISGGESNIRGAELELRGRWPARGEPRWYVIESPLPVREFNRTTKGWEYAGCTPAELLQFIRARVENTPVQDVKN
jgi:hypothetical protein